LTFLLYSCGEPPQRQVIEVIDKFYENSLTKPGELQSENVFFSEKGACITGDLSPSFVLIDTLKINHSTERNLSFWFKFDGEDAAVPQMLFSIRDTINPQNRFNVWIAGRRITAVLNSNHLWANNYDYRNGRSKVYYDSFRLERGKYYYLSINYTPRKIEIYVNAELYQQFEQIENGLMSFQQLYLGIEVTNEGFKHPFAGHIKNLTLFDRLLTVDEIYSLSVASYQGIEKFNKEFELSKFNL
jgi:hypothetical protein